MSLNKFRGVWLPIITPFENGRLDLASYESALRRYLPSGIAGVIPLGTTGESPTVRDDEYYQLIETTLKVVDSAVPVFVGAGGNCTHKVLKMVEKVKGLGVDGILSVCPYYNRPSQAGLKQHFRAIAESFDDLPVLIYNIPYRTGVNLSNQSLLELAELKNIIGVKDSSGDTSQSLELLRNKPDDFLVFTGEDGFFFTSVVNGGDGGILASAHLHTDQFVRVFDLLQQGELNAAREVWHGLSKFIPHLFVEPNPAPLKYCLARLGIIESDEVRLPLCQISDDLQQRLKSELGELL